VGQWKDRARRGSRERMSKRLGGQETEDGGRAKKLDDGRPEAPENRGEPFSAF
jgi:hypothetical protein